MSGPRPSSGRRASRASSTRRASLTRPPQGQPWWKWSLRPWDDDQENDWWFASTAIPLLAATIGPLANVLSIAALVTPWRMCLVPGVTDRVTAAICSWNGDTSILVGDQEGVPLNDPRWCYWLNVVSLIMGFVGNLFLLCNFTNRIRYIIALPVTIIMWYMATGILIGITLSMNIYVPPTRPQQTYTQGFWYAVIASILYLVCSMLLMVNMLGYFLGHYSQRFNLTDSQRTLILQTMLFFIWLAGGGAVFSRVESLYGTEGFNWDYTNALYFCDVTILTVGFGDLYASSNVGRGLVFPYSVGGIIMLGLMISSISRFAAELGSDKVVNKHLERSRTRTIGRTVTSSLDIQRETVLNGGERPAISEPFNPVDRAAQLRIIDPRDTPEGHPGHPHDGSLTPLRGLRRAATRSLSVIRPTKKPRLILLREEKDRFDAMRALQNSTNNFKRWTALSISVTAFAILWCGGAAIFWRAEHEVQSMTYFQALYLCYVSLLTVGYGDLAPKTNAGRPFFVVWSLLAVPTMTILIGHMGDTVIGNFKRASSRLADFTVLPKAGIWRSFLERNPWLLSWLQNRNARKAAKKRLQRGFETGPDPEEEKELDRPPTMDQLATEADQEDDQELARRLAHAIRRIAKDLRLDPPKRYSYEEWVEYTKLIRFTSRSAGDDEDEEEGLIEWDWIGEDSPMMEQRPEADFILDRLCESLARYIKRCAPQPAPSLDVDPRSASGSTLRKRLPANANGDDNDDEREDGSRFAADGTVLQKEDASAG